MPRSLLLGALILCAPAASEALAQVQAGQPRGRYASLYDDSTVAYWRQRYSRNFQWNYRNLLLPALTPAERQRALGMTVDLVERDSSDPHGYYARGPAITVSAASIKFLDDIAVAAAWLERRGFHQGTIAYYADVLKYRDPSSFRDGRYPEPLEALCIPPDALQDRLVDDDAQKILKGSIVFVLAHEMGHVVHQHIGSNDADDQAREFAADSFAVEMFRRIGTPPGGIVTFFLLASHMARHRGDFGTVAGFESFMRDSATHPLSGARLRAVASELRRDMTRFVAQEPDRQRALRAIPRLADEIEKLSPLFDDELLQRYARIVGRHIPLPELCPRRPNDVWIPPGNR